MHELPQPNNAREAFWLLQMPFPEDCVGFKPVMTKGDRALVASFIDAREVATRLSQVLGPDNWQDKYKPGPNDTVVCQLSCRFPTGDDGVRVTDWISREDVGSPSEQPEITDRIKAAYSDALKRAAVKFGVGAYLYGMKFGWVDFDSNTKRIKAEPKLPPDALPTLGPDLGDRLEDVCDEHKVDKVEVLKYYKVSLFEKLPPDAWAGVHRSIRKKKLKKE